MAAKLETEFDPETAVPNADAGSDPEAFGASATSTSFFAASERLSLSLWASRSKMRKLSCGTSCFCRLLQISRTSICTSASTRWRRANASALRLLFLFPKTMTLTSTILNFTKTVEMQALGEGEGELLGRKRKRGGEGAGSEGKTKNGAPSLSVKTSSSWSAQSAEDDQTYEILVYNVSHIDFIMGMQNGRASECCLSTFLSAKKAAGSPIVVVSRYHETHCFDPSPFVQ